MTLTKAILEKQNQDLRTRILNMTAKADIREQEINEQILMLKKESGEMPKQILMLQQGISQRDKKIDEMSAKNKSLTKENKKLTVIIERLKLVIGKLKARFSKNSTTSDKPS